MASPNYKSWKEKRADELGVGENPKNWFYMTDPQNTHTDWYNLTTAMEFADAAKKYGLDPFDFMALGISESGLGNMDPSNPARVYWSKHPNLMKELWHGDDSGDVCMMPTEEESKKQSIDFGAKFLAEKFKDYPDDRLKAIQAYSGLGSTLYGGNPDVVEYNLGSKRAFGKPYDKINYGKEKPQAKRVVRLAEQLKTVPEVVSSVMSPSLMDMLQDRSNKTILNVPDEAKFQTWFKERANKLGLNPNPDDPQQYYDARGAWKAGNRNIIGHLPDTYKTPSHPTFSTESQYYELGMKAGRWEGDTYIPLPLSLAQSSNQRAVPMGQSGMAPFIQSLLQYLR